MVITKLTLRPCSLCSNSDIAFASLPIIIIIVFADIVTTVATYGGVLFQVGVLFCKENAKYWPLLLFCCKFMHYLVILYFLQA